MQRIRLTVAYDGTEFCGWQKQPGCRTVEGTLLEGILALTGEQEPTMIGASRTDSGVHAHGNIAVLDTDSPIPANRFAFALNQKLPPDVRIVRSEACAPDWHPRRQHGEKCYVYRVMNERIEDPLYRRVAQHVHAPLNAERMREAAAYLLGEHDFTSFVNPQSQVLLAGGDAVRTLYGIEIRTAHFCRYDVPCPAGKEMRPGGQETLAPVTAPEKGYYGLIEIRYTGNGFLYHMIRILTGTLLEVGAGRIRPDEIPEILAAKDRRKAGPTAEARGLELYEIRFFEG